MSDICGIDKANELEVEYIKKYNSFSNGYNSTYGGDGVSTNKSGMLGKHHTEDAKEKIRKSKIGKPLSEEQKIKMKEITKNLWNNDEYRNNQMKIRNTKEYKKHLSESLKGKKQPNISMSKRKKIIVYDLDMNLIGKFESHNDASKELNIGLATISRGLNNKIKTIFLFDSIILSYFFIVFWIIFRLVLKSK